MTTFEAIDLLDAMATGAARWDEAHSFGADVERLVAAHRASARAAMDVLLAQNPDSADAVGLTDHLPSQPS